MNLSKETIEKAEQVNVLVRQDGLTPYSACARLKIPYIAYHTYMKNKGQDGSPSEFTSKPLVAPLKKAATIVEESPKQKSPYTPYTASDVQLMIEGLRAGKTAAQIHAESFPNRTLMAVASKLTDLRASLKAERAAEESKETAKYVDEITPQTMIQAYNSRPAPAATTTTIRRRKLKNADKAAIRDMSAAGLSEREIADTLNVALKAVHVYVRDRVKKAAPKKAASKPIVTAIEPNTTNPMYTLTLPATEPKALERTVVRIDWGWVVAGALAGTLIARLVG